MLGICLWCLGPSSVARSLTLRARNIARECVLSSAVFAIFFQVLRHVGVFWKSTATKVISNTQFERGFIVCKMRRLLPWRQKPSAVSQADEPPHSTTTTSRPKKAFPSGVKTLHDPDTSLIEYVFPSISRHRLTVCRLASSLFTASPAIAKRHGPPTTRPNHGRKLSSRPRSRPRAYSHSDTMHMWRTGEVLCHRTGLQITRGIC